MTECREIEASAFDAPWTSHWPGRPVMPLFFDEWTCFQRYVVEAPGGRRPSRLLEGVLAVGGVAAAGVLAALIQGVVL